MSVQCEITAKTAAGAEMGFFERWLTLWAFAAIALFLCWKKSRLDWIV